MESSIPIFGFINNPGMVPLHLLYAGTLKPGLVDQELTYLLQEFGCPHFAGPTMHGHFSEAALHVVIKPLQEGVKL